MGRMAPKLVVIEEKRGEDASLLIVLNGHHDLVEFTLPACAGGDKWELLIDTNVDDQSESGNGHDPAQDGQDDGPNGDEERLFA